MANKIIHKLFPSPVFQFKIENHEEINKQLIKYIYGLKKYSVIIKYNKKALLKGPL